MTRQLMLLAVFAAVYSVANGLTCKTCEFMEAHSDNSNFTPKFPKSDTSCRDSVDEVEEEVCMSEDWKVRKVVCGKLKTSHTATEDTDLGKVRVTYKNIMRSCIPLTDAQKFSKGCHDISEFPEFNKHILQHDDETIGSLEGEVCFCDSDNCNSAPGGYKAVTLAVFVVAALTTILI